MIDIGPHLAELLEHAGEGIIILFFIYAIFIR